MAANLNGAFDLTPLAMKLVESTYGIVIFSFILVLFAVGGFIYLLSKSGVFSTFATYSEHTSKKFHKEIEYKEELINDVSLAEFKDALEHHVKVSKLENFLKHKNKDLDVLKYALFRMDSKRTLKLYERGKEYLEKDPNTKEFKLKDSMNLDKIKCREKIGFSIYFLLNFIGSFPYLTQAVITIFGIKGIKWFSLSDQFLIYISFMFVSFIIVTFLFNPRAAQSFLEAEKIDQDVCKSNTLNDAA
ncbi:hypothetical protein [Acinetobacter johnsonii]|uniref:hypothetical protein n=1 Tax=Acinetobacter johnsonii TaxID=40214 RepID=UPI001F455E00|nr:hypothetical protein [Acinetobacter johnsonii]UJA00762.1 hypothetical protein GBN93_07370 [Acinetobacter johnsonii]